jgi:hypothetical protein
VVELLLARGANVNAKDGYDSTPLHLAAGGGHKEVVELLLAKGANVNAKDRRGQTPLDLAEYYGQPMPGRQLSYEEQQRYKNVADLLHQHGATNGDGPRFGPSQ